ncbi:MAG TPA: carbamoyltransferase C-terminal domain-containing protein, partial [Thermoanaerobaculia bacterium]|nr:carbamoyltransferase C-terminal domain-containing protein [Thermoanaerobaculia bacterium]
SGEPFEQRHKDVAWAAKDVLERAAVELARVALRDSGAERLCLAGGVTMNCKMNGEIIRHTKPVASFIHPASGDSGTAIGAAFAVHQRLCGTLPRRAMSDAYLGPEYGESEIRAVLDECRLKYQRPSDIAATCAGLLARGKIIGWFQGRLEAGARALGHRSILANAADPAMKEKINAQVKHREMWRPFCPSILMEKQAEWLESSDDAPYMIRAMNVLPDRWPLVPSVVHVDGSVRPQSVRPEREGLYWELLRHFEAETGVPLVLNTSFNVRGAPIVCSPTDAIRCFFSTGLDAMGLGPFLIEK